MKEKNEYPIVMKAKDVAEVMGVSKRTAYHIMEIKDFPLIPIGKMKLVTRESFFNWLESGGSK
jgi:predicted DNA-binding transcriptional regulator AlpA